MLKFSLERREMSSVAEMHCMVHEAADIAATSRGWKERVHAAARAFGFEWERTKAFYYRTARRVEAEEMDRARRAIKRLREDAQERKHADHLLWLESEIGRLRASGEEFHGPHVDGLVDFLRLARGEARALAVPQTATIDQRRHTTIDDDQSHD